MQSLFGFERSKVEVIYRVVRVNSNTSWVRTL